MLGIYHADRASRDKALGQLAVEVERKANEFLAEFDATYTDVRLVSALPPISGIARTKRAGGIDPKDGSTLVEWKERLATIFQSMMAYRPTYAQLRYIGIEENGREIVRVDRIDGEPVTASEADLQSAASEPFFGTALNLKPGEIYLSKITVINKRTQTGRSAEPVTYTVLPIFDESGSIFGMIVISLSVREVQKSIQTGKSGNISFSIMTGEGMVYADHRNGLSMAMGRPDPDSPLFRKFSPMLRSLPTGSGKYGYDNQSARFSKKYTFPVKSDIDYLGVTGRVARDELFLLSNMAKERAHLLLFIILAPLGGITFVASNSISRPLTDLVTAVSEMRQSRSNALEKCSRRDDEVGEISREIELLIDKIGDQHQLTEAILSNALEGILTIEPDGKILSVNPNAMALFGYNEQELLGRNISMLMAEPYRSQHDGYLSRYLSTGKTGVIGTTREVTGQRRNGDTFPLELAVTEIRHGDKLSFCGSVRDISSRRQFDMERDRLIESLTKSNSELDQFAYIASHDLRAPLRVMLNAVNWLEDDLAGRLDEESRENLELLRSRANRMDGLLDSLLEYSRVGRHGESRSDLVVGSEMVEEIESLLDLPNTVRLSYSEEFRSQKMAKMPLLTILLNLVGNSVKHHHKPNANVTVGVKVKCDMLEFSVSDDGPGIEPKYQEKVFQMFQTLKPRDKVEGSGMGLAIVRKHVEMAGGQIKLDSVPGCGVTISFTLPAVPDGGQDKGTNDDAI